MAFNQRKFWKFLYEHDDGLFYSLADIIGAEYSESDNEEIKQMCSYLGHSFANNYMNMLPAEEDQDNPNHISQLGINGKTLKDLDVKARITADGRWYYLRAYLAQDFIEAQNELSQSVIQTNKSVRNTNLFIKLTFGAVAVGLILQVLYLCIVRSEGRLNREQIQLLHQQEQSAPPVPVNIYLNDSLRTPKRAK